MVTARHLKPLRQFADAVLSGLQQDRDDCRWGGRSSLQSFPQKRPAGGRAISPPARQLFKVCGRPAQPFTCGSAFRTRVRIRPRWRPHGWRPELSARRFVLVELCQRVSCVGFQQMELRSDAR